MVIKSQENYVFTQASCWGFVVVERDGASHIWSTKTAKIKNQSINKYAIIMPLMHHNNTKTIIYLCDSLCLLN